MQFSRFYPPKSAFTLNIEMIFIKLEAENIIWERCINDFNQIEITIHLNI